MKRLFLVVAMACACAQAEDVVWKSAADGSIDDATKWEPGLPVAGDTANVGVGLEGSFTVTVPAAGYNYGADALLWYANPLGTVTFDGTSGGTFAMPARTDAGYAVTFLAASDEVGPFVSVKRKKVIEKDKIPAPAAATVAQMTSSGAKMRIKRTEGGNEFHFDGGTLNLGDPDGTTLANTVFVGETYDGEGEATDNLVYVHGGTLTLPVLNYTAASSGRNLLQFDGGETTILKASCWPDLRATPPRLTKTDELVVTGPDTTVNFAGGFNLARALNTWEVNAYSGTHKDRTLKMTVTDGATLKGSIVSCLPCVFDLEISDGATLAAGLTLGYESDGIVNRFHGKDATWQTTSFRFGRYDATPGNVVAALTNVTLSGFSSQSIIVGADAAFVSCTGKVDTIFICGSTKGESTVDFEDCKLVGNNYTYLSVGRVPDYDKFSGVTANANVRGGYVRSYHMYIGEAGPNMSGSGRVRVSDGGQLFVPGICTIGSASGVSGEVTVVGAGSCFTNGTAAECAFKIGNAEGSTGALSVLDGALFDLDSALAGKDRAIGFSGDATFVVSNATARFKDVTLAKNASATATVKLVDGALLEVENVLAGAGTATIEADGATIRARKSGVDVLPADAAAVTVGAKGLELDSNGFDVSFGADLAGDGFALGLTGAGRKTLTGEIAATEVSVAEGAADLVGATCADAEVTVAGAAILTLADGEANAVSYAGMTIGDSQPATIAFDAGDTITLAKPPVINKIALSLSGSFENNAYSLFRFKGAMSAASLAAWSAAVVSSGRADGKMYVFDTTTDADGYTHVRMTVADSAPVTDETLWQGAGESAAWDEDANWVGGAKPNFSKIATFRSESAAPTAELSGAQTIGALRFDRQTGTTVTGGGVLTFADSETPFAEATKGEHAVEVPLALPKETAFAVADGATLTMAGDVSNGSVAKTGGGRLVLSGENAFLGKTKLAAGTLAFDGAGSFGFSAASPENAVEQTGGTLALEGEEAVTYVGSVTVKPGESKTAIVKTEADLTLTSVTLTDGDFIKRGAGKLTLTVPAGTSQTIAKDSGNQGAGIVEFPADGSAPATGYCGFNVAEGELVVTGGGSLSASREVIVGLNTPEGTADPVLTLDGSKFSVSSSTYRFSMAPGATEEGAFYTSPKVRIVNGGSFSCHTFRIGTSSDGTVTSSKAMTPEVFLDNGTLSVSWEPSFSPRASVSTTITAQNKSKLLIRQISGTRLHVIVDDSVLASTDYGTPNPIEAFSFGSAYSTDDSQNPLVLDFKSGAGFYCRQFERSGGNGYGNKPVTLTFDDALWTPGAYDMTICPGNGKDVLFDVKDGGLELKVESGKTLLTHKAFTGTGDIVKTGVGTLRFGIQLQITKDGWNPDFYKNVKTNIAERAYTLDCGKAIHVREGTLLIDEGALNPEIEIALEGGSLAFSSGAAMKTVLSGAGTVAGQALTAPVIAFDPAKGSDIAFVDCTIVKKGRFLLRGEAPDPRTRYRIGTWTGSSPFPTDVSWKATGEGIGSLRAKLELDNGVIWATFEQPGLMLLVR